MKIWPFFSKNNRYWLAVLLLACFVLWIPPVLARDNLPERAYIKGVKGLAQSMNLSCESRSAVDWAAYWGVKIGEKQFLRRLPKSDNPDRGFVGNPNDAWGFTPPHSYGVHAEPVAKLLREYGLDARAQRDLSWDDLRYEIAAGRPVIVWVIGQMWEGQSVKYRSQDGGTALVASYEHSMILVGYDPQRVWVRDSYSGQEQVYALHAFLSSWGVLGRMAVTGTGRLPQDTSLPTPTAEAQVTPSPTLEPVIVQRVYLALVWMGPMPELAVPATETPVRLQPPQKTRYVVKRGDYLTLVARRLKVDWRILAEINNLQPPYLLYPGQVLQVP